MKQQIMISRARYQEMRDYVEQQAPLEACSLLAGKNDHVEKVLLIRTQAQSPTRFVMEPYEQLRAFDWIESNDLELLGIFHSHPTGPEVPSPTDIGEAAYEVVQLIWSRNQDHWKIRGFWIENGAWTDVALQIID